MGKIKAPCSHCLRWTFQVVLHSEDRKDAWDDDQKFEVLECSGCGTVSFARRVLMFDDDENKQIEEVDYFPTPVSRGMPGWVIKLPADLEELAREIYQVVWSGQHRLALMGIRALLEQVMVSKVGDQGRFARNLNAFFEEGFISRVQRDAVAAILDAGHASIHRMFKPTVEDLNTALDIAEGLLAAIFVHGDAAKEVTDRLPVRSGKGRIVLFPKRGDFGQSDSGKP